MVDGERVLTALAVIGLITLCAATCIAVALVFDFILSLKDRLTPPCPQCAHCYFEKGCLELYCKSPKAIDAYEKKTCIACVLALPSKEIRGKRTCRFKRKAGDR